MARGVPAVGAAVGAPVVQEAVDPPTAEDKFRYNWTPKPPDLPATEVVEATAGLLDTTIFSMSRFNSSMAFAFR